MDHEGSTALWLALQYITMASDPSVNPFEDSAPVVNGTTFDENSFAAQLIQRGSNPDAPDSSTGIAEPPAPHPGIPPATSSKRSCLPVLSAVMINNTWSVMTKKINQDLFLDWDSRLNS